MEVDATLLEVIPHLTFSINIELVISKYGFQLMSIYAFVMPLLQPM